MRRIVDKNGKVSFGITSLPYQQINYLDFAYQSPMGKPKSNLLKRLNFNAFQYFGAISEQVVFGAAIVNMRLGRVVFCYIYNRQQQQMHSWQFKDIFGLCSSFSNLPNSGYSYFKRQNTSLEFINRQHSEQRLQKTLKLTTKNLRAELEFTTDANYQMMNICTPVGNNGFVYAQKIAGVKAAGYISAAAGDFKFNEQPAYAHHDYSAGYMRRETVWQWACFSASVNGKLVGLNVACGVNETSFTENCYWLDGKLYKIDSVNFEFERKNIIEPWIISSYDGKLNMQFTPQGMHSERQNYIYIASDFKQIFGFFNGYIKHGQQKIKLDNIYGFVEDQYAKW